jgi:uncharacterized protein (DUF1778 family)
MPKPAKANNPVSVRLPPGLRAVIENAAWEKRVTVTEVVTKALARAFKFKLA